MIKAVLAVVGVVLLVLGGTVVAVGALSMGGSGPPNYGQLEVNTSPVKGEIFVGGNHSGFGHALLNLSAGTYRVSFGSVAGYVTPGPSDQKVEAGYATIVNATYAYCGPSCPANSTSSSSTQSSTYSTGWSTVASSTSTTLASTQAPLTYALTVAPSFDGAATSQQVYVFVDGATAGVASGTDPLTLQEPGGGHTVACSAVSGYSTPPSVLVTVPGKVVCSYVSSGASRSQLTVAVYLCQNTLASPGCGTYRALGSQFVTVFVCTGFFYPEAVQGGCPSQQMQVVDPIIGVTDSTGSFTFSVPTSCPSGPGYVGCSIADYVVSTQESAGTQTVLPSKLPTTVKFFVSYHGASAFGLSFFGGLASALGPVGTMVAGAIVAFFGVISIVVAAAIPSAPPSQRGGKRER